MENDRHQISTPLPGYGSALIDRINLYLKIRRYLNFIRERWLISMVFTTIGLGAGIWWAVTLPDQYVAESVLAFAPRIDVGRSEFARTDEITSDQAIQKILSATVVQLVDAKFRESRDGQPAVTTPQLKVDSLRGNAFALKVVSTNFEIAREYSIIWAQEFMEFHKQERKNLVGFTEAKLQQQISSYESKLEQAERALDEFRKKNNISSIQDAGLAAQQRLDLKKAELENLKMELTMAESASREALASGSVSGSQTQTGMSPSEQSGVGKMANVLSGIASNSRYTELRNLIHEIESEIEEKTKILKPKHPAIIELKDRLDEAKFRMKLDLELVEEKRKAIVELRRQQIPGYLKIIDELTIEVQDTAELRNQLIRLQEDRDLIKGNLDVLNRNLQSMGRVGIQEERFTIISQGVGTPLPVGPNRISIIAVGTFAGFGAALGLMFLLHMLDDRIDEPEGIEAALEVPIAGQIPEIDRKDNPEGHVIVSKMKAHMMFAEALRGIRSSILLGAEGDAKRVLVVTSTTPGDGKTTFTTNFAITMAASGNRTLLIDGDLRRGNVHSYFGQPLEKGLADVLEGRIQLSGAIRETSENGLYLMTAGTRPANPSELLIGPRTREVIAKLRKEFDYVIFDSPPLTAIDDTFSIAAFSDGLMFVVRAGVTSMKLAKVALNLVQQRGLNLMGLIINGVSSDNPYYYYTNYYYSSYYQRSAEGEGELQEQASASESRR
ncbi:MAG: polysaccharide biosynthesis tyrosine autokinase [Limisphaerales bacterium]